MGSIITSRPKSRKIDSGKYSLSKKEEPRTHEVIIEGSYSGFVHPANQLSGYQGGSTEDQRKGITRGLIKKTDKSFSPFRHLQQTD